jgi:hypothetical protein
MVSADIRRIVLVRRKARPETPRLSVIVPAFNEKATLATVMDRVLGKSIDGMDLEIVDSDPALGRLRSDPRLTALLKKYRPR